MIPWARVMRLCFRWETSPIILPFILPIWFPQSRFIFIWSPRYRKEKPWSLGFIASGAPGHRSGVVVVFPSLVLPMK